MAATHKLVSPLKKVKDKDQLNLLVNNTKEMVKGSISKIERDLFLIRGLTVMDAMKTLSRSPYGSAMAIAKVLKTAINNALQTGMVTDPTLLYVSQIWANNSLRLKRMRAASKGRPSPRVKTYSWVFIDLSVQHVEG